MVTIALTSNIKSCDKVITGLAIAIEQRQDIELYISVDAHIGIVHVLTNKKVVMVLGRIDVAEQWDVEHTNRLPETLCFRVIVRHSAELLHLVVQIDKPTVLIVERHSDERNIRQLFVLSYQLTFGLVFFHLLGNIVYGVNNVCGMSVVVEFADGMTMEVKPVGILISTAIIQLIEHKLALATFGKTFHLLHKLLLLVGVYTAGKLFERKPLFRQYLPVMVGHTVIMYVVLHHIEVAHVQGFVHHIVKLGRLARSTLYMSLGQTYEEIDECRQEQYGRNNIIDDRRRMTLNTFRVEPLILNQSYLAALLQSRVLVVNLFYELAIATNYMNLRYGYTNIVKDNAFEIKFFYLPLQRLFTPHIVFIVAVKKSQKSHLRRLELHVAVSQRITILEIERRVVAWFEYRTLALELLQRHQAHRIRMHCHTNAVIVNDVLGEHIGIAPISAGIGQYDVGIATLKGLKGYTPLLHDKLTRNA